MDTQRTLNLGARSNPILARAGLSLDSPEPPSGLTLATKQAGGYFSFFCLLIFLALQLPAGYNGFVGQRLRVSARFEPRLEWVLVFDKSCRQIRRLTSHFSKCFIIY